MFSLKTASKISKQQILDKILEEYNVYIVYFTEGKVGIESALGTIRFNFLVKEAIFIGCSL